VTIEDLILRYEIDVLTRIEALGEEKAQMIEWLEDDDDDLFKDCDDQIAHWKATLADIQTVIDREGLRWSTRLSM
jgi:uncharacterized protein YehS (DUF1456 family)